MNESLRRLILVLVFCLAASLAPAGSESQEAAPEMTPEMQAMFALASPGPEHDYFKHLEGEWNTETTFWMAPGAPPTTTLGKATATFILGGRFLQSEFTGDFMGMPFQGLGIDGYDRIQEKFVSVWMDSMGTMIMTMEGSLDKGGKVLKMVSEYIDPMTRKPTKAKTTTTIVSKKKHKFEYFTPGPDGKFFRAMEMIYTRR